MFYLDAMHRVYKLDEVKDTDGRFDHASLDVGEPVRRVNRRFQVAARGQAGGMRHERAWRRAETRGGDSGYQLRRWSALKAEADWSSGSAHGSCSAPEASHSGRPRAGAILALGCRHPI